MLDMRLVAGWRARPKRPWTPCLDDVNAAFPPLGFLIAFAVASAVTMIEHPQLFAGIFNIA